MIKIKLTPDQVELLKTGDVVKTPEGTYMRFPVWVKSTDEEGIYQIVDYDQLPETVTYYYSPTSVPRIENLGL